MTDFLGFLAVAWAYRKVHAERRATRAQRRLRDKHIAGTVALSGLTMMYARYGTDEQLDWAYRKWHGGPPWKETP